MGKLDLRIRAGELRHRVTFLRRAPGQDEMGQPVETFVALFTAWASVGPVSAREYFGAAHNIDDVDAEISIRYDPFSPLRPTDRAQVEGEHGGVFDITGVLNPEQGNRRLRVLAKRIT
jgi:SPP1 family predicted phage head-tail adaptor